ncbi:hypothetical protein X928_01480 [Petrotoga miotherma DSM 10691]|uniref:Uncharacterized protein n=1 Tax=Petrotoga miotherma DSM 10691 TaxID=1434326 RepID=A0A2K1PGX3_9BACT|nr:hypothetical protein X928_01480 [Petrotoga miotherma DSM 10691]
MKIIFLMGGERGEGALTQGFRVPKVSIIKLKFGGAYNNEKSCCFECRW